MPTEAISLLSNINLGCVNEMKSICFSGCSLRMYFSVFCRFVILQHTDSSPSGDFSPSGVCNFFQPCYADLLCRVFDPLGFIFYIWWYIFKSTFCKAHMRIRMKPTDSQYFCSHPAAEKTSLVDYFNARTSRAHAPENPVLVRSHPAVSKCEHHLALELYENHLYYEKHHLPHILRIFLALRQSV